jgi:hypothetical protein
MITRQIRLRPTERPRRPERLRRRKVGLSTFEKLTNKIVQRPPGGAETLFPAILADIRELFKGHTGSIWIVPRRHSRRIGNPPILLQHEQSRGERGEKGGVRQWLRKSSRGRRRQAHCRHYHCHFCRKSQPIILPVQFGCAVLAVPRKRSWIERHAILARWNVLIGIRHPAFAAHHALSNLFKTTYDDRSDVPRLRYWRDRWIPIGTTQIGTVLAKLRIVYRWIGHFPHFGGFEHDSCFANLGSLATVRSASR